MPLTLKDLDIRVPLPKLPSAINLFQLSAPALGDRRRAIDALTKRFELGALKTVELPDFLVFGSRRGEVQFFPASGAVIARDATADAQAKDEERPWKKLQKVKRGDEVRYALDRAQAEKLAKQARGLLDEAGLASEQMQAPVVDLDQWAQLDDKGRELRSGAGAATVKFLYAVEGVPVAGAGAKSLVFAEPEGDGARPSGVFHAWRPLGKPVKLGLPGIEESLKTGLQRDPMLTTFHERGMRISITRLDLRLMALPAFASQRWLYPVFQVEGSATPRKEGERLDFGRFVHAASPEQYAKVDVYAHYLQQPTVEAPGRAQ